MNIATEDLTSVEWRDTAWLERVGGFQNQQMVMDYFSMSPFWDRQCNNQIVYMQTQYNDLRRTYEATQEALRNLKGIEFAVIHEHPPVWVIQKRYRRGPAPDDGEYNRLKGECDLTPRSVNPIATYYIMGANVYQSPSIYSVIANRLLTSLFHVNGAFKDAQKWMDFHPAKGYSWKSSKPTSAEQTKAQPGTLRARENQEFRLLMDRAIETSAMRIAQSRQALSQTDTAAATAAGGGTGKGIADSSLSVAAAAMAAQQRDETTGKRQRKKTEDSSSTKRKKKAK